jgi:hypothetical protein
MKLRIFTIAVLFFLAEACFGQRPAFPLKVCESGRYFIDGSGKPFLYHADTGWQLYSRLTLNEAREYLTLRKGQGFNTIQTMLSMNPDSADRNGQKPFRDYDFARPNEAYFDHVEKVIQIADSLGLLLNLAPLWIGCCGEGYGVGAKIEMYSRNGTNKSHQFGSWLGKRLRKYNHIMWTMGGDNDPLTIRNEIQGLAEGIHALAPQQLITYHARATHSSTDLFQYAPWLSFSMIYTYWRDKPNWYNNPELMPEVYEAALHEYTKSDKMPFILGESQYEGTGIIENDIGLPQQIRRQAYWTMLCGGAGHAYGHDGWYFPANWRTIMKYPGAQQMKYAIDFFTSIPWWELTPDIGHQFIVHGYGEYGKAGYVTTATTANNELLISYLPQPGPVMLDAGKLKGPHLTVRWYNPRTGEYKSGERFPNQGLKKLFSPLQQDWVLIISSEK